MSGGVDLGAACSSLGFVARRGRPGGARPAWHPWLGHANGGHRRRRHGRRRSDGHMVDQTGAGAILRPLGGGALPDGEGQHRWAAQLARVEVRGSADLLRGLLDRRVGVRRLSLVPGVRGTTASPATSTIGLQRGTQVTACRSARSRSGSRLRLCTATTTIRRARLTHPLVCIESRATL